VRSVRTRSAVTERSHEPRRDDAERSDEEEWRR
jgi:hypothetical protein